MKRLLLLLIAIGLAHILPAQGIKSPVILGNAAGNKVVGVNHYSFNVGSPIPYIYKGGATQKLQVGFPYNVLYKGDTFNGPLSVSKGYYPDLIQLRWTMLGNTDLIDHFEVWRRKLGIGEYILAEYVDKSARKWDDRFSEANVIYEYRLKAIGIIGDSRMGYTHIDGVGFRAPIGTVVGRVAFSDGVGVSNVVVTASSTDVVPVSSISLNSNSYIEIPQATSADFSGGFTFQAYLKLSSASASGIFSKDGNFDLSYDGSNFVFKAGASSVKLAYAVPTDTYIHLTAIYKSDSLKIYLPAKVTNEKGQLVNQLLTAAVKATVTLPANNNSMWIGKSEAGYMTGNVDEIRIWKKALTKAEVLTGYSRYISGKETGIYTYLRMNEGFGDHVYDISKTEPNFNENHGNFVGTSVTWSNNVPTLEQLGYKGISDLEGNYIVSGIPYIAEGTSYKFVPMMAPHEFQPGSKMLYLSESSPVFNNIDFTDISKVHVKLNVVYDTIARFPVADVLVKVDGNYIADNKGKLVKTANDGTIEFSVPIGNHYLSFEKQGHTFNHAQFPGGEDEQGNINRYYFIENRSVEIIDLTRVLLKGRIAGGPVEAAKVMNSKTKPSKNNIGVVSVTLKTTKGFPLQKEGVKTISFESDAKTGEYSIAVIPEIFIADGQASIGNEFYSFTSNADLAEIDMTNCFNKISEVDSVFKIVNQEKVFDKVDTVSTYNKRRDWIYRSDPSLEMQNVSGGKIISETSFLFKEETISKTLVLAKETNGVVEYPFGKPIFNFANQYMVKFLAFEKYTNHDSGIEESERIDRVPVTDGDLLIANDLALENKQVKLGLDDQGEAIYSFLADFPNIEDPYTKRMNVTLKTVSGNVALDPYDAYILGGRPTGNNYVTTGPNEIDFILRDPPGSASSASLEKGFTTSTSKTYSQANGEEIESKFNLMLGVDFSTEAGTPFFTVETNIESENSVGVTLKQSYNKTGGYEAKTSMTFGESFSTSSEPDFVGVPGDVFIGHSTNIVYGLNKLMEIMPDKNIQAGSPTIGSPSDSYVISMKEGLRVNPKFNTMFIYSQRIIEEEMIPHLKKLRNISLENQVKYTKVFTDLNDPKYGSNNDDEKLWDHPSTETTDGPSYIFHPVGEIDLENAAIDSVRFFNNEIATWIDVLARNEQEKLAGKEDEQYKNTSFGAGSVYSSSIESSYDSTYTKSYEWTIAPGVATELGFTTNKFGYNSELSIEYKHAGNESNGTGSTETQKVGFTLQDNDASNYFTTDILKCTSGNGPIFKTLGGQSSCPYEGEQLTKYYQPGSETLSYATMKIEGPRLSCSNPISPVLPETSPAYFTFQLSNISEAEKDNWYIIGVDAASNPHGAKVMMDGASINSGVAIFVPYDHPVTKTIEVLKGRSDVNDYENLMITLSSQCDDQISVSVPISAYFKSACSPVEFGLPFDQWVVNCDDNDQMLVKIGKYNLSYEGFEDIYFQYKPTTSSMWTTVRTYTNVQDRVNVQNKIFYIDEKSEIQFTWDMSSLSDRQYDIRLVSSCANGTLNYSKTLTGILDGQRPKLFGTPQPADGILDIADEISVQFNEPIEQGLLLPANFLLTGTTNQGPLNHDAYVKLNGIADFLTIPEGISLSSKSFTIEFWIQPASYGNSVLLAQGNDPAINLEIGLNEGFKTYFKMGEFKVEADLQFSDEVPSDEWQHMAYVFDYETGDVFIYQNDLIISDTRSTKIYYKNAGQIIVGKSPVTNGSYFSGSLHELRIWNKPLSVGDVYASQYTAMSGSEIGLYGYWPMNEAFGTLAEDKAANRHMTVTAPWEVYPGGSSWDFTGNNYLQFLSGYFSIIPEMDYSIEFWFRANNPTANACLFSNQKGDGLEGDTLKTRALSIVATPGGQILVNSQGNVFEAVTTDYFDNTWHHFTLVVKRRGNVASYIDGQLQNQKENSIIGSLEGGSMCLGVRKWKNSINEGKDQYFNGKMDEFRIWNLSKTASQIVLDMNSKLKGDEIGLMAYFPFERYEKDDFGEQIHVKTMDNLVTDANAGAIMPQTPDAYSLDAPNMKDVRPVQAIPYNYVSSEDKVIFNPEEYMLPQLEKNILEITVKGVEDKYGNRLASPVKWTAYVHRNQVRWEDERRTLSKMVNETLVFESSIKNTGGIQVGFTITNLPPWLSASPSSGVINPESTRVIKFTVNPALNIGKYDEDIMLHTENGFDEKLPLTLYVHKTPPNWKINPTAFEYNMNMVGLVKIEDVLSTDVSDMVAAFQEGTDSIRGVADLRYIKELDAYLVFLNVYGNVTGEKLVFRVWDASAGQILDDVLPNNVSFTPNEVIGSTVNPIVFTAKNLFRAYLPLSKGWNWVSFNKLSSAQNNLNTFLGSLESSGNDQIKTHGGGFNNYDPAFGWSFGAIESINNSLMYQIKVSHVDTLIYNGAYIEPESKTIPLSSGWNHIGYIPDFLMDVNEALRLYAASGAEIIKSQYAFAMYDTRVGWLGTLDVMKPGWGYMIKTNQTGNLKYPNTTLLKDATIPMTTNPPNGWASNFSQYEGNMSVVARLETGKVNGVSVNDQMVLGAFINNECHGFTSPITNPAIDYAPFFLNVSNDRADQQIKFLLYDGKSGKTYLIEEAKIYAENAVYGTIQAPVVLTLKGQVTGIGGIESKTFVRCYPNPFSELVTIEYNHCGGELKVDILDELGRVVNHVYNGIPDAGFGSVTWDGTSGNGRVVAAGMYYVRLTSGQTVGTVKITKNR